MPQSVSDDFVMANGVAAYELAAATLRYLETLGVPRGALLRIIDEAQQSVVAKAQAVSHPALQIAEQLLQETAERLAATPSPTH